MAFVTFLFFIDKIKEKCVFQKIFFIAFLMFTLGSLNLVSIYSSQKNFFWALLQIIVLVWLLVEIL